LTATWHTYAAMVRFGLDTCATLDDFRALMAEQADNAKACREEAPEVADEVRRMCVEAKRRLEVGAK